MIRVAAVGDVHASGNPSDALAEGFRDIEQHADLLLLAGDLTRRGTVEEAAALGRQLADVALPKLAVLGNHDHHSGAAAEVARELWDHGVEVLDCRAEVVEVDGWRVGVAGVKGFAGGFGPNVLTAFGEAEIKEFVAHAEHHSRALWQSLTELSARGCDVRIALLHYAPVVDTVCHERPEIHPFLGSQKLAEAIDRAGADLVLHGHAHRGPHEGVTASGIPVRNVAMPLMGEPYRVFRLIPSEER